MIQHQVTKEILTIEVSPEEHEKIKVLADFHGNSIKEYVLESIRERMNYENERKTC